MKHLISSSLIIAAMQSMASAAVLVFTGTLSGLQEVPANASTGTGSVTLNVDNTTFAWTLSGSYSGLTANVTAAHIHGAAPPGANAGVVVGLTHTGGTTGTLSGGGTFSASQFDDLMDGLYYVNVHNASFPGGEVRAQLIPEPSAALLGLFSLGCFIGRRSRKRAVLA